MMYIKVTIVSKHNNLLKLKFDQYICIYMKKLIKFLTNDCLKR